jgi:hypothetical protein
MFAERGNGMKMKRIAKWIHTWQEPRAPRERRCQLVAVGIRPRQILESYGYWPDSERSCDAAGDLRWQLEEKWRKDGWTIVDEDGFPMEDPR